jgi:predicted flap endonuclease-1-like 5' DNA nuclease
MIWLTLETFVLMLLSVFAGVGLGRLLADRWAAPMARFAAVGSPRPWLGETAVKPAAPTLPAAPALLSDGERDRLAASLAEDRAPPAAVASPTVDLAEAPVSEAAPIEAPAVVAAPAAPAVVETSAVEAVEAPAAPVTPPPPVAEADAARAAEADRHGARPAGSAAPLGTADDLKRIKGIGRQNEARLNALGIWHFHQIAAWTPAEARWVGSFLAFVGRIEREDWVGQAKLLAQGTETAFSRRVDAGDVPSSSSEG